MNQLALIAPDENTDLIERTVVVPFRPPSKNKWDGWQPMWQAGLKKKWKKFLLGQFAELQFPTDGVEVEVRSEIWFGSRTRRDWQNYMHPLLNMVADALVEYGVIPDDTPGYFTVPENAGITFAIDVNKFVPKEAKERTVLTFHIRR